MWFKNLQVYRFTTEFSLDLDGLNEALEQKSTRECGDVEAFTLGWEKPVSEGDMYFHAANGCYMFCSKRLERLLPNSVVIDELQEKVDEIEARDNSRLSKKEKNLLKDDIILSLLPKAFIRSTRTYGYIDMNNQWLIINAASVKKAEEFIDLLRDTLSSMPVKPLEVSSSPSRLMTDWLAHKVIPANYVIMEECELRGMEDEGAIIRCKGQDLFSQEIQNHIDADKQVTRLAIEWDERLECILADDLVIRRLKFTDLVLEEAADVDTEDALSRFDTDFTILSLELSRFLPSMIDAFGGLNDS